MSKNDKDDIVGAHKYCANHKTKLLKDKKCGCFHCMKIFSPSEITDWIEDDTDNTAICPYCGIDPFKLATISMTEPGQPTGFIIYFCADCRKVTNVGPFRVPQPIQPAPSPITIPVGVRLPGRR